MGKRIVIAGGTGFLGSILTDHFVKNGHQVVVLSRKPTASNHAQVRLVYWNGATLTGWEKELNGADVLINLAGKSVDCRYTRKNKQAIYDSRLESTGILGKAVSKCENPPKVWINSSSATIYRHAEDRPMDEYTGEIGTGFSVDVCKKWEAMFWAQYAPKTRKVALRTAMVMGKSGGVFPVLKDLVLKGLGGKQGSGNQYVSWIHEVDFIRAIDWVIENEFIEGVYNCSAPYPVLNKWMMTILRRQLHMPFGLPASKWMLEIGAVLLQTETELVLKSRRVVPAKLMESGFVFSQPEFKGAVEKLMEKRYRTHPDYAFV